MQNTQKLQAKPIAICFDAVALNLSNANRPILLTRSQRNPSASDKATSQLVTRSSRHTVISSHGQLVTSEHITKPPVPVVIIYMPSASGDIQKQCSTRTA